MNTYYIELDFVRAEIKETGIAISQGDYGRVKFSIAVKKDGEIITDAASADISFQLTNGYIVQGVLSGAAGLYDYIFQGNELQAPGKTIVTVTLNYADGRTSSEAFSFDIRYNPLYGRFIDAGPYITDLENIKNQAQTYVEYLEKLIEQIKQEMGQTALTKESLANNFDVTEEGVKALDAAAGRALNLNKMDKAAIVQTESTDPSTVPSSAYFKQVTDRVISDLGAELVSDLFAEADKGESAKRIVKTGGSTLNTPYAAGLTGVYNAGIAYINMTGTTYGSITYYVIGQPKMYLASKSAGTWSDWVRIATGPDIYYASTSVESDYNNYIKGGLYQITGSVSKNSPTGQAGSGGILIVFEAQAYVIQFAFNLTTAYYRRYTKSSASWSAWKTFTSN